MRHPSAALLLLALLPTAQPLLLSPHLRRALRPCRSCRVRIQADDEPPLPPPQDTPTPPPAEPEPPNLADKAFTADAYLKSLSRYADDGRSLLRAPQRYSSEQWRTNLGSVTDCRILQAVQGQLLWQGVWALVVSMTYILARGVSIPTLPALPHSLLGGGARHAPRTRTHLQRGQQRLPSPLPLTRPCSRVQ